MKVGTYNTWDEAIVAIDNHWYAEELMDGRLEKTNLLEDSDAFDNLRNPMKSRWYRSSCFSVSSILIISGITMSFNVIPITALIITTVMLCVLAVSFFRFIYRKKPEYTLYKENSNLDTHWSKFEPMYRDNYPADTVHIDYYIESNTFSGATNHKVRSYVAPDMKYLNALIRED